MSDVLRIGVVGLGQRAGLALEVASAATPARVVAAADLSAEGRAYGRELFGPDVQLYEDHRSMFEADLDAVMIFTPDHVHTGPVLDALRAGLAVFVEKPLAIDLADCDEMLEVARSTHQRLYVGHNLRHLPALRIMRRLIDDGAIGQVRAVWCRHFVGHGGDYYFRDWHADRRYTHGLLLQKGAHDLDAIHWLAGSASREVVAMGDLMVYGDPARRRSSPANPASRMPEWFDDTQWPPTALTGLNPVVDVEDISMMLARLGNGVLASYQQCHFTPDYWRNYTVIGDAGRMENLGDAVDDGGAVVQVWNQRRSGYRADADISIPVDSGIGGHGGADAALVGEFLRFVAEGGTTDTSPLAAREAVAAGVAATTSLRSGSVPVAVPPVPDDLADYFAAGQPSSVGPRGR
jgi:predicted dehydrogenase